MAYASISGRARTSARKPEAHAICDRCGFRYNLVDLHWQYDWRGPVVQNLRILVCNPCLDAFQEQQRAIVVPADPTPVVNARTQDFSIAESNYRIISQQPEYDPVTGLPIPSNVFRVTEDGENRGVNPYGIPSSLTQNAVMPYDGSVQKPFAVPLSLLSVTGDMSATVTVTCSKVHGLKTDDQISVEGLNYRYANGFYSVDVVTATKFTYMTYENNPARSLLTPTTRIITALVGLPRGYTRIAKLYAPPLLPEVFGAVCLIELEDGTGAFMLEDGTGFIQLEQCMQPPMETFYFELEGNNGSILLEDGSSFLEQEDAP